MIAKNSIYFTAPEMDEFLEILNIIQWGSGLLKKQDFFDQYDPLTTL